MRFSKVTFAHLCKVLLHLESINIVNIFRVVYLAIITLDFHGLEFYTALKVLALILLSRHLLLEFSIVALRRADEFSASSCISSN